MSVAPTASSPTAPATPHALHAEAVFAAPTATKPVPRAQAVIGVHLLVFLLINDLHQHYQTRAAPSVCPAHALPPQLAQLAILTSLGPTA
jgi:hypothetical protein